MKSYGLRKIGEEKVLKKWKIKPSWRTLKMSSYGAPRDAVRAPDKYEVIEFECTVKNTTSVLDLAIIDKHKTSTENDKLRQKLTEIVDTFKQHKKSLEEAYSIQVSEGIQIMIDNTQKSISEYERKIKALNENN